MNRNIVSYGPLSSPSLSEPASQFLYDAGAGADRRGAASLRNRRFSGSETFDGKPSVGFRSALPFEVISIGFLPGHFEMSSGVARDYMQLSRFHYRAGRPATWAGVVRVKYVGPSGELLLAGVAVLSHPVLSFRVRDRVLGWSRFDASERIREVNASVRTISRVVVHPRFRGLGLSVRMIGWLIDYCDTRYIDAIAQMGLAHPLFKRAGMREVLPEAEGGPGYYYMDTWKVRALGVMNAALSGNERFEGGPKS